VKSNLAKEEVGTLTSSTCQITGSPVSQLASTKSTRLD